MSGIVALFDRDGGDVHRDDLRTMLNEIDHRGPDGRGSWCDDRIALGHQQLWSTPESRFDEQPYRDDELVIVADARVDNRDELFEALDISNSTHPIPDSQLLLEAYRQWGKQCMERIIGAFAFVIWDADEKTVFCARDHLGVKPLYYYRSKDVFACASEPKAILSLPFVPGVLNEVKIGDFLVGRFGDKSNTYFEDIRRIPPAHALKIEYERTDTWQYWDLDPTRTIRLGSDAAYEKRFRELFEQAVQCRLRSSSPVGTTLSGGIDSSSITVMARSLIPAGRPLHTFSWIFDEAPSSDERHYIESVIGRSGIDPHYIQLDDTGVLVDSEHVFGHLDEPPHNSMHYAWWETAKQASNTGVGVLLDGALGDSAVSYGYGLLPDLFRTLRWKTLLEELRQLSSRRGTALRDLFVHKTVKPLVPDPIVRRHQDYRGTPVLEARLNPTIDSEFIEQIGLRDRCIDQYEGGWIDLGTAQEQQYHSILSGLLTSNFEIMDMRGAFFGIEPRHPFADIRLLEFSLAIPASQQLKGGQTRSIIRRSLDELLPDKIRERVGKTSVSEGFWRALSMETDSIRELLNKPGSIERYVDIAALQRGYDRFTSDQPVNAHEARALWRALSLLRWLESREINLGEDDPSSLLHQ